MKHLIIPRLFLFLLLGFAYGENFLPQKWSIGPNHVAAIQSDGGLWMWGRNAEHEINFGGVASITTPFQESGYSSWLDVSAGDGFTIAIRADSSLWAWGTNSYGQFMSTFPSESDDPYQISQEKWKAIYTGNNLCFGIKSDGTLWGWGSNALRLLPTGSTDVQLSPVQIGTATWVSLSIGEDFIVALATDSTVWAWGNNTQYQLGMIGASFFAEPTQLNIQGTFKKVLAGNGFAGALTTDYKLWMWGRNDEYQRAELFAGAEPTMVDDDWVDFALGSTYAIAVTRYAAAYWWGTWRGEENFFPVRVSDLPVFQRISQVHAYQENVFLTNEDGIVFATGPNGSGQLGIRNTLNQSLFVQMNPNPPSWYPKMDLCLIMTYGDTLYDIRNALRMPVGSTIASISLENRQPSRVVVNVEGTRLLIKAIPGVSGYDTLFVAVRDQNDSLIHAIIPVWVDADTQKGVNAIDIDAGFYFSAAIFPDSTLWYWGANFSGRFGNGSEDGSFIPVQGNAYKWKQISLGSYHSLGIMVDSTLWSWGLGGPGLLALNTMANILTPTKTSDTKWLDVQCDYMTCVGLQADSTLWRWGIGTENVYIPLKMNDEKWIHIGSGETTIFAIRADSTLWAWGQNLRGELGVGDLESRYTDMAQVGSDKWIDVDAGSGWAMGIQSDGTLWAWGFRAWCGEATTTNNSSTPISISSAEWKTIDVNGTLGAALFNDETLWTLGSNNNGALGDGRSICRESLGKVSDQTWKLIAVSSGHMLATDYDGKVFSWGENFQGQLGNGNTYWHSGPQPVPNLNPPPRTIAKMDTVYQLQEEGPSISIALSDLIEDPEDEPLVWYTHSGGNPITALVQGNNLVLESPYLNWNGEGSVVVFATDPDGNSAVYEVKCLVKDVNDAPQIVSYNLIQGEEDVPIHIGRFINVEDPEEDLINYGVLIEDPIVAMVNGLLYLKNDFNGSFYVSAFPEDDRGGVGASVKMLVTVSPVNDAPEWVNKSPRFMYEDDSLEIKLGELKLVDLESDPSFWSLRPGDYYTLHNNTIIPDPNWNGILRIEVTTTDNKDTRYRQYMQVGVIPVNDPPVIDSIWSRATNANKSIEVTNDFVFYHDQENDSCTIVVGEGETYSVEGTTITPNRGFSGVITVPIWVTDSKDTSRVSFLKLTVNKPLGLLDREGVLTPEGKPGRAFDLLGRRYLKTHQ